MMDYETIVDYNVNVLDVADELFVLGEKFSG